MSESNKLGDSKRRNFLIKVTSVVGGAGAAAACIPFVASMNPSSDVLAKATTEVDLSGIPVGGVHTVAWQGKPVFRVSSRPGRNKGDGGFGRRIRSRAGRQAGDQAAMAGRDRYLHPFGLCP